MHSDQPQFLEIASGKRRRRIAYLKSEGERDGRPGLVWLPGLRSDMASTKASALGAWALKNRLALLRFDYSGHGRSTGRFEEATIGQWLEDSAVAIARLTAGPQVLIGSSMGGWIALLLARGMCDETSPIRGRIAGLALIAPAWDMTEALLIAAMPEEAKLALARDGVWLRPSRYGDGPYPITRELIEEGRRHLLAGAAARIDCPLRVLHGMEDRDVPWLHSMRLVEQLACTDVQLTLIKDGEHRLSRPQDLKLLLGTIEAMTRTL